MFEGFKARRIKTSGAEIHLRTGGRGPAVLMLHGYPQSHVMWRHMAPRLSDRFTVVCPDLRGYGDSSVPEPDLEHHTYSKRAMAADMTEVMTALGFERFAVVGHDRGARVGYRLVLDNPGRVTRFCSFDVAPTGAVWNHANKSWAVGAFHWSFLAQPHPKPETLIKGDPDYWLSWLIESWSVSMDGIEDAMEIYKAHHREPARIRAMCEDYRAGATVDDAIDQEDLASGRKLDCPVLAIKGGGRSAGGCGEAGFEVWRDWADDVTIDVFPCGHFVPEEMPDEAVRALLPFLNPGLG